MNNKGILFLLFLVVFSCTYSENKLSDFRTDPIPAVIKDTSEVGKMLYAIIPYYVKKEVHWRLSDFDLENGRFVIDTIYYNQKRTKFLSIIISQRNEQNFNFPDVPHSISGDVLIGYKDTLGVWKVYYFEEYMPVGFTSYAEVQSKMRRYFKSESFKQNTRYVNSLTESFKKETVPIRYGVDDVRFWTESVIWQQRRILWLYTFETSLDGRGGFERVHIPHPDSLPEW